MTTNSFDPIPFMEQLYSDTAPRLPFQAKNSDELLKWQRSLRSALKRQLGGFPKRKTPLEPHYLERVEFDDYSRQKVILNTRPGLQMPAFLLTPKEPKEKLRGMVCVPGHGRGKDDIVGIDDDGNQRSEYGGYQNDFAIQAVRKGFVVLAIEQFCFGERNSAKENAQGCHVPTVNALCAGTTMIGIRVYDFIRAVDFLKTLPAVHSSRIGCMGISGGGTTTLFASAIDTRIKAAFVSGYLNEFKSSILAMNHCVDNFVPGITGLAEMPDIAGLIAPRPAFFENGTDDTIFPVDAFLRAVKQVEKIYRIAGAREKTGHEIFEGEHQFYGVGGFEFLEREL